MFFIQIGKSLFFASSCAICSMQNVFRSTKRGMCSGLGCKSIDHWNLLLFTFNCCKVHFHVTLVSRQRNNLFNTVVVGRFVYFVFNCNKYGNWSFLIFIREFYADMFILFLVVINMVIGSF